MGGDAELREVLELIARDRRAMLERLGFGLNVGNPQAVYRRVIGESASPTTRERLARAWAAAANAHEEQVAQALHTLLGDGRRGASGRGRVDRGGLWAYQMVEGAAAAQEKLEAEVLAVTATAHCPAAHFWYALRTVFGEVTAPSFTLDECMAFVGKVARDELALELHGTGTGTGTGTGQGRMSFVEAKELFRGVGQAIGRIRREKYRAAWFEMWAYHREFAGVYGSLKLAERRPGLMPRVVAAVLENQSRAGRTRTREEFALLDNRFGVGAWCTLSDVAGCLLRGGVTEGLREQAWCAKRLPGGGTIFDFYEAAGKLEQRLGS